MQIDFIHDIACPFCRIGKRHLDLALEEWHGPPVEVNFRSFLLNASIPARGYEFTEYMKAKGGGKMTMEQFFAAPRLMGQEVGLIFNFEKITRAPNTLLAHRLILITPKEQRNNIVDTLYAAYFEFGQDIGDIEVLLEIADKTELKTSALRALLLSDTALANVESDSWWAHRIGVSGVPYFIINETISLGGAQPPQAIIQALQQAAETKGVTI